MQIHFSCASNVCGYDFVSFEYIRDRLLPGCHTQRIKETKERGREIRQCTDSQVNQVCQWRDSH